MKLLLVQPPVEDFYDTDVRLQPIGLSYLAGALRDRLPQVAVEILDFHHGYGRRTLPLPRELSYLEPFYPYPDESPFCAFHHYYRFGASAPEMARALAERGPDLVGISSLFTPYHREALEVARLVKASTKARVVMGGSHVSAEPESTLREDSVDFVVVGEGEDALVRLVRALSEGPDLVRLAAIPGLGYKDGGSLHLNPPAAGPALDELPLPELTTLRPDRYRFHGRPMAFLVTSRSCPHRCSFCSVHRTFGTRYRRLTVPRVIEEMKLRYREGYRVFDFEDDNLTYYQEEMKELCGAIRAEFSGGDVELVAMNGISYLSLDSELLRLMKEAGFTRLNLSLVSSDLSVLETTKRPHTVSKYLQVVEEAHRLGFRITSYQILGLPFETLDGMVQTLAFQARLPVLLGASPFYLTPGSPIHRELGIELTEEDHFKARLTAMAWEGETFTREDLYTLFVTTRILDFLKSWKLEPSVEVPLGRLLEEGARERRRRLGIEILKRLLESGVLHAAVGGERKPLTRFDPKLFFRVLAEAGSVSTISGARICF